MSVKQVVLAQGWGRLKRNVPFVIYTPSPHHPEVGDYLKDFLIGATTPTGCKERPRYPLIEYRPARFSAGGVGVWIFGESEFPLSRTLDSWQWRRPEWKDIPDDVFRNAIWLACECSDHPDANPFRKHEMPDLCPACIAAGFTTSRRWQVELANEVRRSSGEEEEKE